MSKGPQAWARRPQSHLRGFFAFAKIRFDFENPLKVRELRAVTFGVQVHVCSLAVGGQGRGAGDGPRTSFLGHPACTARPTV